MNLLVITRKIDLADSRTGFFVSWVEKLAARVEKLHVICWQKSQAENLPSNIIIHNLPASKILKILTLKIKLLKLLPRVNGVFIHMMPLYAILAGPFCKIFHKKLVLWYTHKSVNLKLKLANLFINEFITASPESFRLKTKKRINIFGHGIDINRFAPIAKIQDTNSKRFSNLKSYKPLPTSYKLISVGRISPSKDYESMIKAIYELKQRGIGNLKLKIVGAPALAGDQVYLTALRQMANKMELGSAVEFSGALPRAKIPAILSQSDLFVNLSATGSLDKAVLEAMACGCLVLTGNEAFQPILPPELLVEKDNPKALADKIEWAIKLSPEKYSIYAKQLRQNIVTNHNLDNLIKKIIGLYNLP